MQYRSTNSEGKARGMSASSNSYKPIPRAQPEGQVLLYAYKARDWLITIF